MVTMKKTLYTDITLSIISEIPVRLKLKASYTAAIGTPSKIFSPNQRRTHQSMYVRTYVVHIVRIISARSHFSHVSWGCTYLYCVTT